MLSSTSAPIAGLDGKVIIVTGGGSGIGAAIAQVLTQCGATAVCADVQDNMADRPAAAPFETVSTTDAAALQALAARVIAQHGHIDGLVTSAGVSRSGDVADMPLEQWQEVLDINLTGSMLAVRAVVPHMRARGQGSIVNIASINGMIGNQGNLAYCTSKAGVLQLMRCVAADVGPSGVRINAISPGLIETPMTAMLQGRPTLEAFEKQHLLGRSGRAQEVANVAAFLLSDLASFVTGANIPVDGGFSAAKVITI